MDEILAALPFAVRENYLSKVARGAVIGERICFQGATAKNRALVAAFEQGLGKPILVSRYCHLTGALGRRARALRPGRDGNRGTVFRGSLRSRPGRRCPDPGRNLRPSARITAACA